MEKGCVLALTGKASEAIQMITSGIATYRSTGSRVYLPFFLLHLSRAHAEIGQFDDAWRCIGEAMTAVETTKERWCEAEINRLTGEIALQLPQLDSSQAEAYFERALAVARAATGEILGTACGNEHGASLARPGQAAAGSRTARSGLWLVQ